MMKEARAVETRAGWSLNLPSATCADKSTQDLQPVTCNLITRPCDHLRTPLF
jgi:hypothetical protein